MYTTYELYYTGTFFSSFQFSYVIDTISGIVKRGAVCLEAEAFEQFSSLDAPLSSGEPRPVFFQYSGVNRK